MKFKFTLINPGGDSNTKTKEGFKYKSIHPLNNLLTNINIGIRTRSLLRKLCAFFSFVSHIGSKHYDEALEDINWILAIKDELN